MATGRLLSFFFDKVKKNKILTIFFLIIAAQQIFFILKFPPVYEADTATYIEPANQILENKTFYSDMRVPGYPVMIAAATKAAGPHTAMAIVIFQHLLGLLMWLMTISILKTRRMQIIFSVLWLMDMLFNSYQHVILPDFMLSFLLFSSAAFLYIGKNTNISHRNFLLSGLFLAMALLTKPVMYLFFIFAVPIFYFLKGGIRKKTAHYAVFAILPLLAININCFNNYIHTGKYSFLTFSGSYSFFTFINFIEPGNSRLAPFFDKTVLHRPMGNEEKIKVSAEIERKILSSGYKPEEIDSEFKKIFIRSVIRHPVIFAKKTIYETAHFFLNAHNQYAKHYSENMAFNLGEAVKKGDYRAAFRKFLYSMHFFYWVVFLLFAAYLVITILHALKNRKHNTDTSSAPYEKYFFEIYSMWLIFYITAVTVLTCQGDARYRVPLQPFMLYFAAISADRLISSIKNRKKSIPLQQSHA